MKKYFILSLFFCIFIINFVSADEVLNYSYTQNIDGVQITQLKYDPYPVSPGEYFDIWIQAKLGNSKYVKFEVVKDYPFSIDGNEDPIREYTSANGREVVMHFKVRVDDDAVEGENAFKLKVNGNLISSFPIQISDAQTDFDLVIQESSGSDISIAIANIGKNTANSLIVRIPEQDSYRISGTNGQMVGNLDSGDYTIVSFSLSQVGREGKLQIQLDYTDSIGERRSLVKNVEFISTSPIGFNMTSNGQIPAGNFPRGNFQQQNSNSIFKSIWLWIVIIVLIGVIYLYYRKNSDYVKNIFFKKDKKFIDEKNSKKVPDWVSAERTKNR